MRFALLLKGETGQPSGRGHNGLDVLVDVALEGFATRPARRHGHFPQARLGHRRVGERTAELFVVSLATMSAPGVPAGTKKPLHRWVLISG